MRAERLHSGSSDKRLSQGRFRWWPAATGTLEAHQLPVLLAGGDAAAAKGAAVWRRVDPRE